MQSFAVSFLIAATKMGLGLLTVFFCVGMGAAVYQEQPDKEKYNNSADNIDEIHL